MGFGENYNESSQYIYNETISKLASNYDIVRKIYDVMFIHFDSNYVLKKEQAARMEEVCTYFGIELKGDDEITVTQNTNFGNIRETPTTYYVNRYNSAKNKIQAIFNKINLLSKNARDYGIASPENPVQLIAKTLDVGPNEEWATNVILLLGFYLDIINSDTYKFSSLYGNINPASLSSFAINTGDGMTNSLGKFFPDMDAIKQKKAEEALAFFDFSKRTVKTMFTCAYKGTGTKEVGQNKTISLDVDSCIVGWKKINDAAGYIIRRRELFSGEDISYDVSNEKLSEMSFLDDYVNKNILSFYGEDVDKNSVCKILDYDIKKHSYYVYDITAYKKSDYDKLQIFSDEGTVLTEQIANIKATPSGDALPPYFLLSAQNFGLQECDWIIAGANIKNAINKNYPKSDVRKYSYITATVQTLNGFIANGKFIIPSYKNISDTQTRIKDHIKTYGAIETLIEVLRDTGCLYAFDGIDFVVPLNNLTKTDATPASSNLIGLIAAAIDPETLTLDLSILEANFNNRYSYANAKSNSAAFSKTSPSFSKSQEILIDNRQIITEQQADDAVQFQNTIKNQSKGFIDLTMIEGISTVIKWLHGHATSKKIVEITNL
jgi:hypothetical protein